MATVYDFFEIKCFTMTLTLVCHHQGTVNMEGGKLTIDFPKYNHTSEIRGGKLVEVRYHRI